MLKGSLENYFPERKNTQRRHRNVQPVVQIYFPFSLRFGEAQIWRTSKPLPLCVYWPNMGKERWFRSQKFAYAQRPVSAAQPRSTTTKRKKKLLVEKKLQVSKSEFEEEASLRNQCFFKSVALGVENGQYWWYCNVTTVLLPSDWSTETNSITKVAFGWWEALSAFSLQQTRVHDD